MGRYLYILELFFMFHCSNMNDTKITQNYDNFKGKSRPNSVEVKRYEKNGNEDIKVKPVHKSVDSKKLKTSKTELNNNINISTINNGKDIKLDNKSLLTATQEITYSLSASSNNINTKSNIKSYTLIDPLIDPFKIMNNNKCINFDVKIELTEYKKKSKFKPIKIIMSTKGIKEKILLVQFQNCKFSYEVIDENDKDVTNSILIVKYSDKANIENNIQSKDFLTIYPNTETRKYINNTGKNEFTLKLICNQKEDEDMKSDDVLKSKNVSNEKQRYHIKFYLIDTEGTKIPFGSVEV